MATIRTRKPTKPVTIDNFLGVNEGAEGQLNLKLGEASNIVNFRITQDYKLKKREGYSQVREIFLNHKVQGMWYGTISVWHGASSLENRYQILIACGGQLYVWDITLETLTLVENGTLTDAPTRFIQFGNKVYVSNGYEYKVYNGTSLMTVQGYRPKIAVGTPPVGGGTPFEQINLLTGAKHQTFSGNGTATVYQLAETSINSVDFVQVNGVTKTLTTDYTVDLTNGKITFVTAPTTGQDNVDIGWTKGTGQRDLIEKCRFSMNYSGKTNSRIFLWGNNDHKNRRFWSGLANGVPSAEYFEANAYSDEGNGEFAITDITKLYDRQYIFLEKGVKYSYYETQTVENQVLATFPSFELNDAIGNKAEGQTQIINNKIISLYKDIHAWQPSTVKDQTNEKIISDRVKTSVSAANLSTAITVNWESRTEYWIILGSTVLIYNYGNDTWYKFNNLPIEACIVAEKDLYFCMNGYLYKFNETKRTDNGTVINATWESGFYDFEAEYLTKYMNNIWLSINPATKTSVDVQVVTNNEGTSEKQTVYYSLATFLNANFAHFSFSTSYNPQPKYLEIQAYGFVYMKLIISNSSETDKATVLSINLPARYGGKVR